MGSGGGGSSSGSAAVAPDELRLAKAKVKQVELLMDEKDKEYERKLRTLRQEAERVKELVKVNADKCTRTERVTRFF